MTHKESSGLKLVLHRDFGTLLFGQVASRIGNGVNWVAVMWVVYESTGSPLKMSLVGICQVGPLILLGPFLGAYLDRADRKTVMIICDIACALCVAMIPLLDRFGVLTLWLVYLLVVAKALFAELFSIGINSGVPLIVPNKDLPAANSLLAGSVQTGQLVGPALAAYLMSVFGAHQVLYFDSATFLMSGVCVGLTRIPRADRKSETDKRIWSETWEGLVFLVRGGSVLLYIVAMVAAVNLCIPSLMVLIPIYSAEILGAGKEGFAVIFSGWGAGTMSAFLFIASHRERFRDYRWITRAYMLSGSSVVVLGLCGNLYLSMLSFALMGFCIGTASVLISTLIQRITPPHMRGRVFAMYGMGTHATIPFGMLAAGALCIHYRPDLLIVWVGLALLIAALAGAIFMNPQPEQNKLQQLEKSL
ncbi:MFS transporter [Desulfobacca acetoxidans]